MTLLQKTIILVNKGREFGPLHRFGQKSAC